MGVLIHFPTERFAGITRATEQPHPVERMAAWIRKAAHMRASASLGCEVTLEYAPNIVPLRSKTRSEVMANAVATYCHNRNYSGYIVGDAIRVGLMRVKEGKSLASAIQSAKARADFAATLGPKSPGPEVA